MDSLPARRVLIIDDHPIVRLGLATTLDGRTEFAVCGAAVDAEAAREAVEAQKPDAAILDLSLGGRDGAALVEDLIAIHPDLRILVYTYLTEALHAVPLLKAGAQGYLAKKADPAEVVEALRTIFRGHLAISDGVRQRLLSPEAADKGLHAPLSGNLSNRELQVFRLLGEGLDSAGIASGLGISIKTIGTYRERLKTKLNLASAHALEAAARGFVREGGFEEPRN